MNLWPVL